MVSVQPQVTFSSGLKVLRTSCLEDRWVESLLKRWTFVSLQYVGHRLNNLVFPSIEFYFAHYHAEQAFLWRILVEQWFLGCAAEAFVPIARLGWEMYKNPSAFLDLW